MTLTVKEHLQALISVCANRRYWHDEARATRARSDGHTPLHRHGIEVSAVQTGIAAQLVILDLFQLYIRWIANDDIEATALKDRMECTKPMKGFRVRLPFALSILLHARLTSKKVIELHL